MTTYIPIKTETLHISSSYYFKQIEFETSLTEVLRSKHLSDLDQVSNKRVIFDLSKSYWHDLGALLWLITLLYRLKRQGNELELSFPDPVDEKSDRVWHFLNRWRFFDVLANCVDEPANLLKPHQVPLMMKPSKYAVASGQDENHQLTILHTAKILEITTLRPGQEESGGRIKLGGLENKYFDKVIVAALSRLCGWDHLTTTIFLRRVLREGVVNSALHSGGSFANISMLLDSKNLTLVISDNGIGIPEVLRKAYKQRGSDAQLIKYFAGHQMILDSGWIRFSTERGSTSRPGRKGMGLYYLKDLVLRQGGELRIRSGKACIDFAKQPVEYDDMLTSPGTMIRVQTPLKI